MSKLLRFCLYGTIFTAVFNFTAPLMGGVYSASSLGGSSEISHYDIPFFGLGQACGFPLGGYLGNRFGKLNALIFIFPLFIIASLLCASATLFPALVLFRFLAGLCSGPFLPLASNLIDEGTPPEKKASSFAFIATLITVTPVLGASFGGWIAYDYRWSEVFYLQIPFMTFLFFGLLFHYRKTESQPTPFDGVGFIFYVITVSAIVTSITLGQQLDWFRSPLICVLFSTVLLTGPFFFLWERRHPTPFIDVRLLKIPSIAMVLFSLIILFSSYFGMILLLALWLNLDANYTPKWIALLVLHMLFAGLILFILLIKKVIHKMSFQFVLISAFFFAVSCFYSTIFNVEINFGRIAFSRILAGFGLAFFLFPLLLAGLKKTPPGKESHFQVLFHSVRLLSGSLGCSVYTTIWYRRRIFYHERLGEQLTAYSELTTQYLSNLTFHGIRENQTNAVLEQALEQQSTALALDDSFYLMGWIITCLFVILCLFFLKTRVFRKTADLTV